MKKVGKVSLVFILAMVVVLFASCSCTPEDTDEEIILSFGGTTQQYFNGTIPLYPIKGEAVAEGDAVEQATVILLASSETKMQLSLEYETGFSGIQGLMISVNDTIISFEDKAVLYSSASPETRAELNVLIFLKGTDISEKGKTIKFYFVLSEVA